MSDLNLDDFLGGWLVGDFSPALLQRDDIEVGVKRLEAGFIDDAHYHLNSSEYNVLLEGTLSHNRTVIKKGSIFVFRPGEIAKVEALTDSLILVIRDGSGVNDKHLVLKK